jgi:YVTN family beta-propeller protein
VANADDSTVSVVDAHSYEVTAVVPTGQTPTGITVRPDGREAYVADVDGGTVTVLDLAAG